MANLLPTSIFGGYPLPDFLDARRKLNENLPQQAHQSELWRVNTEWLELQSALAAVRDQERAGLDIVDDVALSGDLTLTGTSVRRDKGSETDPRIGEARTHKHDSSEHTWTRHAHRSKRVAFLRAHTRRRLKATMTGPFTSARQLQIENASARRELAMRYASAVQSAIQDLFAAGADVVQLNEPEILKCPREARAFGFEALAKALEGEIAQASIQIYYGDAQSSEDHLAHSPYIPNLGIRCVEQLYFDLTKKDFNSRFLEEIRGKQIVLGVLDLSNNDVEPPQLVAQRIRCALRHVDIDNVVVAPDLSLQHLSRDIARAKLCSMVAGAAIVRQEITGETFD